MANETVYITSNEDSHVMSEKVQSLAGSIYKEFERVIKKYDEDVVKDLMPLVVGILEALDASSIEKQELDVELELLREDNEQLLTQYEREKQHRKVAEQKYLEMEDNLEGAKKELEDKVETLESILRMSEIKSKNAADHVSRLEDREQEAKNEYSRLHERYTELFRTHMDYVERTKILLGTDKLSEPTVTVPRIMKGGIIVPEMCPVIVAPGGRMEYQRQDSRTEEPRAEEPRGGTNNSLSLLHELQTPTDREQLTDSISVTRKAIDKRLNQTLAEIIATTPELVETHDFLKSEASPGKSSNDHDESSVFEEIQTTDIAEVEFGAEISGACPVSISDDAGSDEGGEESKENDRETAGPVVETVGVNFFGMCKELENLIVENKELLATKNALNIVKNDLITRIDVLTSEQEIQKQEINMHNTVRKKLQERISKLEEELRKLKEELEGRNKDQTEKEDDEVRS